jgi:glycosyltransferase involved in cell wall biosynthesis
MNQSRSSALLSILIPTYNRADLLDLNLRELTSQISHDLHSEIEVIVSNNASTDQTEKILEKYKSLPYFKVIANKTNLGFDGNFSTLVDHATGRFNWIFGDDDILLNQGLQRAVDLIRSHPDVGLIHLSVAEHQTPETIDKTKSYIGAHIKIYEDANAFLSDVGSHISFITSHIFNHHYLAAEFDRSSFYGSNLIQECFYLQAALKGPYNIFVHDYYFSQLANNTGSYKLFDTFATRQHQILRSFVQYGLKKETIRGIYKKMLRYFFPSFIVENKKFASEQRFSILIENFWTYPQFWIYCFPFFLIPSPLRPFTFKVLRRVVGAVKRTTRTRSVTNVQ